MSCCDFSCIQWPELQKLSLNGEWGAREAQKGEWGAREAQKGKWGTRKAQKDT